MARVLVVEDEHDVREVYAEVIRGLGHDVAEAADGVAAVKQIDDRRPSAIVLDLQLPRMNGYDVLQHVRATDGASETPVIVVSATATGKWSLRHGATAYLAKPFDLARLSAVVQGALTSRH